MILDTSFVVDVLNGRESAVEKMKEIENSSENKSVTPPTIFELWSGVEQSEIPEREKESIKSVLNSMQTTELSEREAKIGGRIDGQMIQQGEKVQPEDCMIAGAAIKRSEKAVSSDSDFLRIAEHTELRVETY